MRQRDTIAALATPPGSAALAIIRVSGKNAVDICSKFIRQITTSLPRQIRLYKFVDFNENLVDEVTAIRYQEPKSLTGEDMVEIFCHGNTIIVEKILSCLFGAGARKAERGEFSRRAFLNGKISLLQAEAIRGLVEERTLLGLGNALANYFGGCLRVVKNLRKDLIQVMSELEAGIEFGEEEDVEERKAPREWIKKKLIAMVGVVESELKLREKIKKASRGIVVAIVGPANAGKSTLFNSLLGSERSIVYDSPGTTRDFISERFFLGNEEITLIDTAGISEKSVLNEVENISITRSWDYIKEADLAIWVSAANEEFTVEEIKISDMRKRSATIGVVSKIDLSYEGKKLQWFSQQEIAAIATQLNKNSASSVRAVLCLLEKKLEELRKIDGYQNCIIQNERHEEIVGRIKRKIEDAEESYIKSEGEEIVSEHLREALRYLDDLEGRNATEEVLDEIFSRFCIGK